MRRLLAVIVFTVLAAAPSAGAAPVFFVDGHGWGHGIGLAQYGAQGFATRDGRDHAWILSHYYRGTTLSTTSVSTVRVLLADGAGSATVGSAGPYSLTDGSGRTYALPAGRVTLGSPLRVTVDGKTHALASPVRFNRGGRVLELGGKPYRGALVVALSGGRLSVVNHVGVEEYLYGVVPDEMPPSWAPEALKAQAVAARTYALVSRRTGGSFDLFSDTRSQVYGGVRSEDARTNAAIDATAAKVVTYGGRLAWTFFHSTSGGRTAAIHHVWNADAIPYLVSVPDPHDDLSPYHSWGPFRYTAAQLRSKLRPLAPSGSLRDVTVSANASLRAGTVTARGSGGTRTFAGTSFQTRLGLRSSWFSVSVVDLSGAPRVEFGKGAKLRGIARGFRSASIEQRVRGGAWGAATAVARRPDGTFTVVAKPRVTTWYRVRTPKGTSTEHRVAVAPLVRLSEPAGRRALVGFVRPKRAGSAVTVQRFANGTWRTVGSARTDASGAFRSSLRVVPGRFRALAVVGSAYGRGVSPVLTVARR